MSGSTYKTLRKLFTSLVTLSWLFLLPASAYAAATLDNISYSTLPGNKVQIKLSLSGETAEPISFTTDDPARIALTFADTNNKLAKKTQAIGVGVARSVTAVEAGGRTRVVLNLVRLVPYNVEKRGNDVFITLDTGGNSSGTSTASATPAAVAADTGSHDISNVDFRRGSKGEGRVVVTMSDPKTIVDLREEGGKIIADFLNAQLPEQLEQRLDVGDFATPVANIDTFKHGKNVRMVIEPGIAEYEHLAYQADNVLTIDVRQISKDKQAELKKKKFGYVGEKLSLNFQNIEVRSVLQLIADFTGLNLITSDTVQGNLTLRLKNVPWDQALDIILKTKGLSKRQTGSVILVAPTEEIAAREKLELESQKQIEELAPLRSEYIQVNYAKAADLAALLKAESNSLLSVRGNVSIDERTNTLLVQDTADKLAEIRILVGKLDIPIRQVLIESRVVVADDDFSKDLGVRFGIANREDNNPNTGSTNRVIAGNLTGTTDLLNFDTLTNTDGLNVNLPANNVNAASIALAIAKLPFGNLLQLELSALQEEGRGETISNPRVVTGNQKEAYIEQGTEIPYLEASSSGAATVSFKKAVLSLKVTPQITPDDRIIMDLTVTEDTLGALVPVGGGSVPSINTQEVTTQVLVDNGETVVLGGVYSRVQSERSERVPFFGDIPYVGFLFRNKAQTDDKRELLIFVTPKIIKDALQLN
ncbi:type IV pilus secretin PilQ family protein [Sulfuriflexus mobilis]|uniref:type IV pilus secretin PilQ family protein n=1 Tax=Sulfuriflexus mobilis TaxID=1811807 RepID=UPI001E393C46|nr:type IV pilus secretin PilQ family protein [Sulfuriflexus mobilis]